MCVASKTENIFQVMMANDLLRTRLASSSEIPFGQKDHTELSLLFFQKHHNIVPSGTTSIIEATRNILFYSKSKPMNLGYNVFFLSRWEMCYCVENITNCVQFE